MRFSVRRPAALTVLALIGLTTAFPLSQVAQAQSTGTQSTVVPSTVALPSTTLLPATLSSRDKDIYAKAFALVEKDRWSDARQMATKAKHPLPAKVIQWLDLTRPGPGRDFQEMTNFLRDNPDWPLRETLFSQAERAMPDDYPTDNVIAWFKGREPNTPDGVIKLATAYASKKLTDQLSRLVRNSWIDMDFSKDQEATFLQLFGSLLKPSDHETRLDRLLWDGNPEQSGRMLARVDAPHRVLAQARLALEAQASNAGALLSQVPPALRKDPGLIYDQAHWLRLNGDVEKAAALLDPAPQHVLRPDKLWAELKRAARLSLDKGDISVAYRLAANHGATSGDAFVEGEWLAGWISLRFLQDPATASKHFTALYSGTKSAVSQASAAYWAGRAAEQAGNKAKAQDWYHLSIKAATTFYSLLAADRLNEKEVWQLRDTPVPQAADKAAFERQELVKVVRLLGLLDQSDRTRPFIFKLRDMATKSSDYFLTAELATEVDRDDLAVFVARQARQAGTEMIQYLYPMPMVPKTTTPEPGLVLGVIRQESAFLNTAASPAGALGLMQLMPATAKQVAKEAGLKYNEKALTQDAQYNIQLGSAYLEKLIDRFDGSYVLAAAAYNAGPSRAADWVDTYGDPRSPRTDPVDWVESIPFDETRNYVQRVMENLEIYRARLNKGIIKLTLESDLRRAHQP
jgi:soluble lytic murein transglycosylase